MACLNAKKPPFEVVFAIFPLFCLIKNVLNDGVDKRFKIVCAT